jgi:hypothetical protein
MKTLVPFLLALLGQVAEAKTVFLSNFDHQKLQVEESYTSVSAIDPETGRLEGFFSPLRCRHPSEFPPHGEPFSSTGF